MGGFAHHLASALKTGFDLTDVGQRYKNQKRQQAQDEEARNQSDFEFADLIQNRGGRIAQSGMVQDDNGALRRADPSRMVRHKTAQGGTIEFELPTVEEQLQRKHKLEMQSFEEDTSKRRTLADESVDTAGRQAAARANSERAATAADREQNGIALPAELDQILPGISMGGMSRPVASAPMAAGSDPGQFPTREGRKVLPGEFDDIVRTVGNYGNVQSQIAERGKKPAKKIQASRDIEDKGGNMVQVITYDDGSIEEKPLNAKGKGKDATGVGALTQQQQITNARNDRKDQEATVNTWQGKLDKLQTDQQALVSKQEGLMVERANLKAQLGYVEGTDAKGNKAWVKQGEGDPDMGAAARVRAQGRINEIENAVKSGTEQIAALESQKKSTDTIRRGVMGQSQAAADTAQAGAADAAQGATDANPIAQDGKGNLMQWDGSKWATIKKAGGK